MTRHVVIGGQRRHLAGWKPNRRDHRDARFLLPHLAATVALAAEGGIDQALMPEILDQGEEGSCTGHSAAYADQVLQARQGIPVVVPARQFIYRMTRVQIEGVPADEDSGATIRDTCKAWAMFGLPPEAMWPYLPENLAAAPTPEVVDEAAKHKLPLYLHCPTFWTVKAALAQGFPVIIGFPVPASVQSAECAKTGVIHPPGSDEEIVGGHAICLQGYSDLTRRVRFPQSWGRSWGEDGYGYLDYGFFEGDQPLAEDACSPRQVQP